MPPTQEEQIVDCDSNLTYKNEGNNNPKSKYYSLKAHHPSKHSGVTIGRGYDFKLRSAAEIRDHLTKAGFPPEKIEILVQASGLSHDKADQFVERNKDLRISIQEQEQLFRVVYPIYQADTKRLFPGELWERLSPSQKEVLVDLRYQGVNTPETRKIIVPAIKKMLETGDSSHFDKVFDDHKLWIKFGSNMERIKSRRENLKEKFAADDVTANNSQASTRVSSPNLSFDIPKGGIDLSLDKQIQLKDIDKLRFCGIVFDSKRNDFLLLRDKSTSFSINNPKEPLQNVNNVKFDDLAVILKIFYDPSITHKMVSFSLDPFEKTNPQGPYMRKVFYPDELENRRILAGTRLGEELFEADYIMKQLSLGVQPDNKSKFIYPEELKSLGLKPQHEMRDLKEGFSGMKWSRAWIIINDVMVCKHKQDALLIEGVEMGVESRQLHVTADGSLKDQPSQDPSDECYKFSKKLSEVYEPTSAYYQSFRRVKEISNAIVMGKWIYENKAPVDLELVNQIYERNLLSNYTTKVPAINFTEMIEIAENVPISLDEIAKRSLEASKLEVNPENIKLAIKQIQEKHPGKTFSDTLIKKQQYFLFGGVDLTSCLAKKDLEKNSLDDNFSEKSTDISFTSPKSGKEQSKKIVFEENKNSKYSKLFVKKGKQINVDLTEFNVARFPLIKQEFCCLCDRNLEYSDLKSCFSLKKVLGGKFYCSAHNPMTCSTCLRFIQGSYLSIKNQNYHSECVNCFHCEQKIKETSMVCENELLFHSDCYKIYLKNRDEIFQLADWSKKTEEEEEAFGGKKRNSAKFEDEIIQKKKEEMQLNRDQRGKTIQSIKDGPSIQKIQKH